MNIVQGNTLTFKNSDGKLIKFSKWIPNGNQVERDVFTYKSLFNNNDIDDVDANGEQLSLFGDIEDTDSWKNKSVQLTKVYEG